jgi:hypothetical protein
MLAQAACQTVNEWLLTCVVPAESLLALEDYPMLRRRERGGQQLGQTLEEQVRVRERV